MPSHAPSRPHPGAKTFNKLDLMPLDVDDLHPGLMPLNPEGKKLKERLQACGAVYEKVSVRVRDYLQFEAGWFL